MSGCDLQSMSKAVIKTGDDIEGYKQTFSAFFNKMLGGGDKQVMTKNFINDFIEIITMADKNIQETIGFKENIPDSADTLIKNMTMGAHKTLESFLKTSSPELQDVVMQEIGNSMRYIAAQWDDPKKVMENERLSKKFRHAFQYYSTLTHPVNFMGIPIGTWMNDMNKRLQFLHNRGSMFRYYEPANNIYQTLTGLTNSTSAYGKYMRVAVANTINKHEGGALTGYMIIKLARFLDPSQHVENLSNENYASVQQKIDDRIKQELSTDQFNITDDAVKTDVVNRLRAFQKDYNLLNYGFDSLWYEKTPGQWTKRTKQDIIDNNINTVKSADDNFAGPAFTKFLLLSGNRLAKLAESSGSADPRLQILKDSFLSMEEGQGFQLRDNYFPSSREDDFLSFTGNDSFNRLYSDMEPLHERADLYADKNYDLMTITNNNMKVFKQFFTSMSEFSAGVALRKELNNAKALQKNNKMVYDSLSMFADEMIKEYGADVPVAKTHIRLLKQFTSAGIGLMAGSILTFSAFKNYFAALMTASSRYNPIDLMNIRKDYKLALEGKGGDQALAQAIREKYRIYDSFEKISDVIQVESSNNQKKGLDWIGNWLSQEGAIENLEGGLKGMQKFADLSVNKILGIIPHTALTPGFNQSENNIHKMAEWMAYHKAVTITEELEKHRSAKVVSYDQTAEQLRKEVINAVSDDVFTKVKEMAGDFSKYSKPFWSWRKLRDSETAGQVILGGLLTTSYMFKQVNVVNSEVMKSMYSNAVASGKTGTFGATGTAVPSAGGTLLLAMMEMVAIAMEENEKLPEVYLVTGTSPLHDQYKYIMAMYGITQMMSNGHISEKMMEHTIDVTRNMTGVLGGNAFRNFKNPAAVKEVESFTDFIDQITLNTDVFGQFANTLYSGLYLNAGDNWDFMKQMNKAIEKNVVFFGHSNDYVKAVRDMAFITRSINDGKYQDAESVVWNQIKGNLLGFNIKYAKQDKDWDNSGDLYKMVKMYQHMSFMNRTYGTPQWKTAEGQALSMLEKTSRYYGSGNTLSFKIRNNLDRMMKNNG